MSRQPCILCSRLLGLMSCTLFWKHHGGSGLVSHAVKQQRVAAGPQDTQASAELCMRAVHAAEPASGGYVFHCAASEALLHGGLIGELSSVSAVHMPVLLLTSQALLVLSNGGTQLAASIPFAGIATALHQCHSVVSTRLTMHAGACRCPQAWSLELLSCLQVPS